MIISRTFHVAEKDKIFFLFYGWVIFHFIYLFIYGWVIFHCLFNLYAEYITRNAGLEEAQAGIEIAGRNISNLRYADTKCYSFSLATERYSEQLTERVSYWKHIFFHSMRSIIFFKRLPPRQLSLFSTSELLCKYIILYLKSRDYVIWVFDSYMFVIVMLIIPKPAKFKNPILPM